jgi:hypothetical protein
VRRGFARNLGLSANQVLHIPGAGDFQIKHMRVLDKPAALGSIRKARAGQSSNNGNSASSMEVSITQQAFIVPDPQQQEQLVRENEADELVGEQTWPTDKVFPNLLLCFGSFTLVTSAQVQEMTVGAFEHQRSSKMLHVVVPVA